MHLPTHLEVPRALSSRLSACPFASFPPQKPPHEAASSCPAPSGRTGRIIGHGCPDALWLSPIYMMRGARGGTGLATQNGLTPPLSLSRPVQQQPQHPHRMQPRVWTGKGGTIRCPSSRLQTISDARLACVPTFAGGSDKCAARKGPRIAGPGRPTTLGTPPSMDTGPAPWQKRTDGPGETRDCGIGDGMFVQEVRTNSNDMQACPFG